MIWMNIRIGKYSEYLNIPIIVKLEAKLLFWWKILFGNIIPSNTSSNLTKNSCNVSLAFYCLKYIWSCWDEQVEAREKNWDNESLLIGFLSNSFKQFQGFTLFNISQMSNMSDSKAKRDLYSLWKF